MPKRGTTKFFSKKQEKKVAEALKGKEVIASGALWSAKADVRSDVFLCECKTTEKDYYRLTPTTWLKIRDEAVKDGIRQPLMCIEVNDKKKGLIGFAVFNNDELQLFNEADIVQFILVTRTLRVDSGLFNTNLKVVKYKYSVGVYPPITVTLCPWEIFQEKAEEKGLI